MKTLNRFLIIAALFVCTILHAQTAPPLTVIVVIDQLPITLITENMDLFSEDGFKRLDRDGVFYTECRYRHGVLETGPGHATIATGCDPKTHGIVGNSWRNPDGSEEYCVQCDSSILLVSEVGGVAMGSSNCPDNIMVDGLSDAWRGKFGADAKIWSMSLKDRAAIAMGGKSPTGVLWSNKGGRLSPVRITSADFRAGAESAMKIFGFMISRGKRSKSLAISKLAILSSRALTTWPVKQNQTLSRSSYRPTTVSC